MIDFQAIYDSTPCDGYLEASRTMLVLNDIAERGIEGARDLHEDLAVAASAAIRFCTDEVCGIRTDLHIARVVGLIVQTIPDFLEFAGSSKTLV